MKIFNRISVAIVMLLLMYGSTGWCLPSVDWEPVKGHEDNMVAYGHVVLDGVDFGNGKFVLFTFGPGGNGDCRSRSAIRSDGFFYATIVGSISGESLEFKVLDTGTGDTTTLQDVITFQADETEKDLNIK